MDRKRWFHIAVTAGICFVAIASQAQTSQALVPQAFEVAAIKVESPHSTEELVKGVGLFSVCTYPTNRFFVHNASLRNILAMAFDGTTDHISGPDWLKSQVYSIDAKVEGDKRLSREEMKPLLRKLLEDRFHLQAHSETKSDSGYTLVAAKSGPKLSPSKDGVEPHGQVLPGHLQAWHISLQDFALFLSNSAGRPVADGTNIKGAYDFDLRFATSDHPNANQADIFTAVQEQLRLKLVPGKVPVDYIVIDHVERVPTEN